MVPHAGVEPALLSELDFESSASTNSANGAQGYKISAAWIYTKVFAVVNHIFNEYMVRKYEERFRACGMYENKHRRLGKRSPETATRPGAATITKACKGDAGEAIYSACRRT